MKKAWVLLLLVALVVLYFYTSMPLSSAKALERKIEHRFGIEIEASSVPFAQKITGAPCLDEAQLKSALSVLESVLVLYPRTLASVAQLKCIYICTKLTSFVTPVAGVTVNSSGVTTVYLNADFLNSPDYLTRTLHHELLHAIEFAHPYDNAAWKSLNPYEPYLEDITPAGAVVYYAEGCVPPFEPGFISEYARVRPREDRAELFAHLMQSRPLSDSEYAMLAGDPFLQDKIKSLCSTLDTLFDHTDNLWDQHAAQYAQSQFTTQQVYAAKSGTAVRTGPSDSYPLTSAENPLRFTGLFHAQNGDRLLILLDKNGKRIYALEKELLRMEDIAPASQ